MENTENDLVAQRRQKLEALRALGVDPFGGRFATDGSVADLRTRFVGRRLEV